MEPNNIAQRNRDRLLQNRTEHIKLSFDQYQRYRMVTEIINNERLQSTLNILDIGSGPVDMREFLPYDKIIRLDMEDRREEGYVCGSALRMPFQDESFDASISCDMYEHIAVDEREMFLKEINRVSKQMFVIACPFSDGNVERAEDLANSFYKSLFGHDNRWLIEHKESGLPSLESLLGWVRARGYEMEMLHNGSLNTWLPMMLLNTYLEERGNWEIFFRLNNIYAREIYSYDNYPPSYRKIVVVRKNPNEGRRKSGYFGTGEKKDLPGMIMSALNEKIKEDVALIINIRNKDDERKILNKTIKSIAANECLLNDFNEKINKYFTETCRDEKDLKGDIFDFIEPFKEAHYNFLDDVSERYKKGDINADTVINFLCKYIEAKPESGKGWNNLGVVLAERGDSIEAKYAFFNACLLDHPTAYRNLWHLFMALDDSESARKIMNEGIKKGLDMVCFNALSIVNAMSLAKEPGLLLERVEQNEKRLNILQMEKERLFAALEKYRRFAMISEKVIEEKEACISNAQAVIKGNEQNWKLIAEMVLELNSALPAIRDLSEHLGREDNVTGLMVKLGEICFNFGSNENARFFFEKAVSLDSDNCDALNNLGVMHYQQGNYETAKDFFTKALIANPENKEARINIGLVNEMKTGRI